MPQLNAEQARVAQTFTLWFNNPDQVTSTHAVCITPREAIAQWCDATGAITADFDIAANLLADGTIVVEDGRSCAPVGGPDGRRSVPPQGPRDVPGPSGIGRLLVSVVGAHSL